MQNTTAPKTIAVLSAAATSMLFLMSCEEKKSPAEKIIEDIQKIDEKVEGVEDKAKDSVENTQNIIDEINN